MEKLGYQLPTVAIKKFGDRGQHTVEVDYAINSAKNMRNYPFAGWLLQKNINEHVTLGREVFTQGAVSHDSRSFTVMSVGR